jgi:hypothetical protein
VEFDSVRMCSNLVLVTPSTKVLKTTYCINEIKNGYKDVEKKIESLYWFPVASFPMQGILFISAMDLESKYCYFYHSWDLVPYYTYLLNSFKALVPS